MALSDIDTSLITVGQPTDGGCTYVCVGTPSSVPTDASAKMSTFSDFTSCGTISENGFTISNSVTTNKFKDWGGNVVLTAISEEENTFQIEFAEINRPVVAQLKYGADNVTTGTDGSVASVKAVAGTTQEVALVIDELESNGFLRRTVVPRATIDSFDDETHQKGSLLVYGMTFTALLKDGASYYVYRAKPTSTASTSNTSTSSSTKLS